MRRRQSCADEIKDEVKALFEAAGPAAARSKAWSAKLAAKLAAVGNGGGGPGGDAGCEVAGALDAFGEALVRLHLVAPRSALWHSTTSPHYQCAEM